MIDERRSATTTVVHETVEPRAERVGALEIRRYLPGLQRQMIGPFIFMDQGGPIEVPSGAMGGVPEHPHAGLSTFTYLMAGSIRHEDSAGNVGVVQSGDVALMTAGSGITHEEVPADLAEPSPTRELAFAQMWLALPDEVEESEPRFQHVTKAHVPTVDLADAQVRVAMGTGWGVTAPTHTHTDTIFAEVAIVPGGEIQIEPAWEERALILIEGDAALNGRRMKPLDLPVLDRTSTVTLTSSGGGRLLLLGGDQFTSERHIAGSFVASSPDKIRQWMIDYRDGNFPRIDRTATN